MICIKNVHLYNPENQGRKDILIGGGKILEIADCIDVDFAEVFDAEGKICVPGLIDQHIHITGGGGEGGFATKTPEVELSSLIRGGITTLVGLLGTDGYSRDIENLLSKAKALKSHGLTVLCTTGSYGYPSVTLTGSIAKDIMFVEEVIGCKLALSDHRSSHITLEELTRLASDVRVAGMLSSKPGILMLHMGDESTALKQVNQILDTTGIPALLFRPTHVTRNEQLFEEAIQFNHRGGMIDCTAGSEERPFAKFYFRLKDAGCDMNKVTLSSDGQGSWSNYDKAGNLVEIGVSSVAALHDELRRMVKKYNIPLEEALLCMTKNVAQGLNLYPRKGALLKNSDADLILMDQDFNIDSVMTSAGWMMKERKLLKKGYFE